MFYKTREAADAAFERLANKGIINRYTYYVDYDDRIDAFYITTWDYNEDWED